MRVALAQAPMFDRNTPSNGLALLCAHLKRAGIQPLVHDASIAVHRELSKGLNLKSNYREEILERSWQNADAVSSLVDKEVDRLLAWEPDVVGFSVLTHTETWSLEMASRIKRRNPRCKIIFGGSQCLRENMAFDFAGRPCVDAVVVGEADITLARFLQALEPGSARLPNLPGVLTKDGDQIVDGGDPEVVEDLDQLPFLDFSQFPMEDYDGDRIFISTTRGCVRRCSFCTHIVQQKVYRTMSAPRTLAEIRHQMRQYPRRCLVEFSDSLINGNVSRLAELSDLFIEYRKERLVSHPGLDFGWTGMAILHPTMTFDLLRKMRMGGCRVLKYGLESASQKVVQAMRKNFKVCDAENVILDTHRAGIESYLFIMVGYPGESEEDFQETLDFIYRHGGDAVTGVAISCCEIQKGSELDVHPERFGIRAPVTDGVRWESEDGSSTHELRQERMRRVYDLAERLGLPYNYVASTRAGKFTGNSLPEEASLSLTGRG